MQKNEIQEETPTGKITGMIHIYTGDGKGKTTAAAGLALRFAGSGGRVLYTQFLKRNDSSELCALEQIRKIELFRCEKCFGFTFQMSEETRAEAREFYTDYFCKIVQKVKQEKQKYGMLILDELTAVYTQQLVDRDAVLDFLKDRPKELEVVITGRDAAKELIELADYVSEIRQIRHPYEKGIAARRGIEM